MKIKKILSKFLKIKRIKEIETMLSVKLPQDYKRFLLENNGAINSNYKLCFKVKELADCITLDVFFCIDTNNNADFLKMNKSLENDKVPNSVLIADTIQHGFVVIICSEADKGVYYWDDSHSYNISNEDCNMYKIANDFGEFLKILEYHDEEASIPYKNKVKWCPICNQGWVEIVKNNETGKPLLRCDECFTVWNNPEQIERNNASGLALDILTVYPTEIDIEKWGWKKYIMKK